ncbi:MAG: hypothetical protein IH849_12815 [Acidobacteria bacterium]|nr:hypothetical protein [Acidobacteriota bacterium]
MLEQLVVALLFDIFHFVRRVIFAAFILCEPLGGFAGIDQRVFECTVTTERRSDTVRPRDNGRPLKVRQVSVLFVRIWNLTRRITAAAPVPSIEQFSSILRQASLNQSRFIQAVEGCCKAVIPGFRWD